jgi:CelD/BcsL family acetyltransferase involved in cellulose biosynthesis
MATVLELGRANRQTRSGASGFRVEFVSDWKLAASRWNGDGRATSFQHDQWLDAWYGAFQSVSPLIAIISDATTRREVALVPLARRVHKGIGLVEFPDLGLTDYNAPLLGPAAPTDAAEARALCRALVAALRRLPEPADLIRMQKMPAAIDGRPNPLVALGREGSCSLNGNLIEIGDDFEAYRTSIKKMQLPRSWRVFNRYPGASFRIVTDIAEATKLLDAMDAQQQARMRCLGIEFNLNEGARAGFYRDLVARGIGQGYAIVSALRCDEAIVATMLGIRHGKNFIFLRISNAGRRWSHCSPSRLIIERTMDALHQDGVREFDLSIGNYAFKRRFGAVPFPLTDVSIALGWRGIPYVLRDRAAQRLRRYPWLAERVGRALGRLSRDDE